MSTEPRVETVEGYTGVRAALAHVPGLPQALTRVQERIWDPATTSVELDVKELGRLRNARITDCGY